MSVALQVKKGSNDPWSFTVSDTTSGVVSLVSDRVQFRMRKSEWATDNLFGRDTKGAGSDYIDVTAPASDGNVTITPTASDWAAIGSDDGLFIGEFRISDSSTSDSGYEFSKDIEIEIEESLYG